MRLGRHMPTNSKPVRAVEIAHQIGCEAIQIFASNPTAWKPPTEGVVSAQEFAKAVQNLGLYPVVLHAPYLINLGTLDETNWNKSVTLLSWTLQRGALLSAKYVVFHTGSHRGAGVEAGIARIAEGIDKILQETPPEVELLLENDVGAGNSLGHSFEQFASILALVPQYSNRVGICLDTAHLWGAGHDISLRSSTEQVLDHFDQTVGLARLKVIHLNDTEKALGSHRDVHARLGEGIIGEEGLRTLLNDTRLSHVAVILETPIKTDENKQEDWEHDKGQITKARELAGLLDPPATVVRS